MSTTSPQCSACNSRSAKNNQAEFTAIFFHHNQQWKHQDANLTCGSWKVSRFHYYRTTQAASIDVYWPLPSRGVIAESFHPLVMWLPIFCHSSFHQTSRSSYCRRRSVDVPRKTITFIHHYGINIKINKRKYRILASLSICNHMFFLSENWDSSDHLPHEKYIKYRPDYSTLVRVPGMSTFWNSWRRTLKFQSSKIINRCVNEVGLSSSTQRAEVIMCFRLQIPE